MILNLVLVKIPTHVKNCFQKLWLPGFCISYCLGEWTAAATHWGAIICLELDRNLRMTKPVFDPHQLVLPQISSVAGCIRSIQSFLWPWIRARSMDGTRPAAHSADPSCMWQLVGSINFAYHQRKFCWQTSQHMSHEICQSKCRNQCQHRDRMG